MKKRGRPPLDPSDRRAQVTVYLPSRELDTLCRKAQREDVSVSEVIRRKIRVSKLENRQD